MYTIWNDILPLRSGILGAGVLMEGRRAWSREARFLLNCRIVPVIFVGYVCDFTE
jgi:hypothetical protein